MRAADLCALWLGGLRGHRSRSAMLLLERFDESLVILRHALNWDLAYVSYLPGLSSSPRADGCTCRALSTTEES